MTNNNNFSSDAIQLFLRHYNSYHMDELCLYDIDLESIKYNCVIIKSRVYLKLGKLLNFLQSWDYKKSGPLYGIELINNGFSDLLTIFDEIGDRLTNHNNEPINVYKIKKNKPLDLLYLASIIWRLEICYSVLPYIKEGKRYRYVQNHSIEQKRIEECINGYLKFIKFGYQLKENNPYVDVRVLPNEYGYTYTEFYPRTIIMINGYPYIMYRQSNVNSSYADIRYQPIYSLYEKGYASIGYQLLDYREISQSEEQFQTMQDVLDKVFQLPDTFKEIKEIILSEIHSIFKLDIKNIRVYYDWVRDCYCIDPDSEDLLFNDISIVPSTGTVFCKYTTMETLLNILLTKKMRMNSIVCMNDPTETEKMKTEGSNFIFYKETEEDIKKNSNYYFIVSFTTKEDELDMWRFYGDNGAGVCLVFQPFEDVSHNLWDVNYVDFKSEMFSNIESLLSRLECKNIRFSICSYVFKNLLMKPKDFKTEAEARLIELSTEPYGFAIYGNKILTPYVEKELKNRYTPNCTQDDFPLRLSKIILGPEMQNKIINKGQIEFLIKSKLENYEDIEVVLSAISCYRN